MPRSHDHAIVVGAGADGESTIACGEIGGTLTDDGNLVVGLREENGSGLAGIALLAPSVVDPATTDVSVYLASGLAAVEATERTDERGEDATAGATATSSP